MIYNKTFDNGLRLIVKKMDGLFSVTTGFLVGTGSSFENEKENGISHYIEHMMFKGTQKRNAFQISDDMDKIGAQVNAFTSKEMTCYYVKSTYEHTETAFEILADMFLNATFPDDEARKEKGVIVEEISMNEDTPDDLVFDVLAEAIYGKKGYGRSILGTPENVNSFTLNDVKEYMSKRYSPDNLIISMAGNIELDDAIKMVEKYFLPFMQNSSLDKRDKGIEYNHNSLFRKKDIEQIHIAMGYPSVKTGDRLCDATQVLNVVLGGGMSSRLFQKVREELGLAYSVYSYNSKYEDAGTLNIYAGVNPKNIEKCLNTIQTVIKDVKKNGITQEEFIRGKEQIKSSLIYAQESTSSQMLLYGKYLMYEKGTFDFNKRIEDINNLTMDNIVEATQNNFDENKLSIGVVGKIDKPLSL